jgi:hypothetical protein
LLVPIYKSLISKDAGTWQEAVKSSTSSSSQQQQQQEEEENVEEQLQETLLH